MKNIAPKLLWLLLIVFSWTASAQTLAELEEASGGRLGVYAVNTANDLEVFYRADEIFPTGSTYKILPVSAILTQDALLQEQITYTENDLVTWSPVTEQHVQAGMRVIELCEAAISYSDNTATKLLIDKLGGSVPIADFARTIENESFSMETPGDFSHTATPLAMAESLRTLTLGDVLAVAQRTQLITWLQNNTTGKARIRAGVPKGWMVGDKTGSGDYGLTNDIGIIWPPGGEPIIVAVYFIQDDKNAQRRPDVVADATRIVLQKFGY